MNLVRSDVPALCSELVSLQRWRTVAIRSRIKSANRLQAVIACYLGYRANMEEKERLSYFAEAAKAIKDPAGHGLPDRVCDLVKGTMTGVDALDEYKNDLEGQMRAAAAQLPAAAWTKKPEQRGFGVLFLGVVVGEAGDLGNYPPPEHRCGPRGKVEGVYRLWRRMGCSPWTFEGDTRMGSTWKSGKYGGLPASEWMSYGYSPRRRSIAYLIGENMVKQNFVGGDKDAPGPYRKRYEEGRKVYEGLHPDYPKQAGHRHGMLVAAKLLLKNLWLVWNERV